MFEALNRIPKDGHGVDMMRVRDWALRWVTACWLMDTVKDRASGLGLSQARGGPGACSTALQAHSLTRPPLLPLSVCSGRASLYRQTILLSSFPSAEMNALLGRTCRNHAGKVRLWPTHRGVLGHIIPQARQVFERLPAPAAADGAAPMTGAKNGGVRGLGPGCLLLGWTTSLV